MELFCAKKRHHLGRWDQEKILILDQNRCISFHKENVERKVGKGYAFWPGFGVRFVTYNLEYWCQNDAPDTHTPRPPRSSLEFHQEEQVFFKLWKFGRNWKIFIPTMFDLRARKHARAKSHILKNWKTNYENPKSAPRSAPGLLLSAPRSPSPSPQRSHIFVKKFQKKFKNHNFEFSICFQKFKNHNFEFSICQSQFKKCLFYGLLGVGVDGHRLGAADVFGLDLADKILKIYPNLKIIYSKNLKIIIFWKNLVGGGEKSDEENAIHGCGGTKIKCRQISKIQIIWEIWLIFLAGWLMDCRSGGEKCDFDKYWWNLLMIYFLFFATPKTNKFSHLNDKNKPWRHNKKHLARQQSKNYFKLINHDE